MEKKDLTLLERLINGIINNNYMNTTSGAQFSSVGNLGMTSDAEEELMRAMRYRMPPENYPAMMQQRNPNRVQMFAQGMADRGLANLTDESIDELISTMKQIKTKKKKRTKFKNFR